MSRPARFARLLPFLLPAALAGCASTPAPETPGPKAREEIVAVTASHRLLRFNAGQPQRLRDAKPLQGLRAGERIVGIDFRVARGELFALGASGQLYRIDVAAATAVAVGTPVALPAGGQSWGFDFNPTVDRIRVVNETGVNLRLHPDTGALIDADPAQPGVQLDGRLAYDAGDANAGKPAGVVAAAYSYNKDNEKISTNYALDAAQGTLVHQGTKEGVTPAVSPNSGRLYTVGALGLPRFDQATFDLSDIGNVAYAGVHAQGERVTRWVRIDLATGKATPIGRVGGGEPLVGAAIEP